jgi:Zn-dependent peptidase ImmA (M78 family)
MMTPPVWVTELAERFWSAAGSPPSFPHDLETAATNAALLSLIDRQHLRLSTVLEFLQRQQVPVVLAEPDRPLRAALYCWRGVGYLFLDSTDPPDERRFSLAHEVAHFLRDYDAVRRKLTRSVGPAVLPVLPVLDGTRPPTADERIQAVLRNSPLAPHTHIMNRDADGRPKSEAEQEAEDRADRLAFELLAPAECFRDETDRHHVEARLVAEFGLPHLAARTYSALLLPPPLPAGMFVERLKKIG